MQSAASPTKQAAVIEPIKVGAMAPDLIGGTADARVLRLSTIGAKFIVVYFYPKDATPGCTREAQEFRDLYAQFSALDAAVVGVSRDTSRSHANFSLKQSLPFALVADVDEIWCRAFDVIHEKLLYGKRHLGVVRSTFLLDAQLRVLHAWRGVKVPGHAADVLEAIGSIG